MIEEKKTYSHKKELALSAIMFFSPLIKNQIQKRSDISNYEKDFLKGFIKLGNFNIILLIISIGLQIIFYLTRYSMFEVLSLITSIVLAIFLIIGSIYAISDKEILTNNKSKDLIKSDFDKLHIITSFIPLYNIYLRYTKHDFDNPDLIIKESILWRTIFIFILIIFQKININLTLITIIIIRILLILNHVDLGSKTKEILNNLFKKNPEELRGYLSGIVITIFNQKTLQENISSQKNKYELIFKIEYKQILLEYVLLFILSLFFIYKGYENHNNYIIIFCVGILSRYTLMIFKRKRVPHIPILYEITNLFFKNKKQ